MDKSILRFLSTSLFFIVFGSIFIVVFINSTDAECDLQPDPTYTCRISKQFLGKYAVSERVVEDITDVTVEDDGCSDGCAYRVEFIRNNGRQEPFNNVYTDRGPVNRQAEYFRSQISSSEKTFTYYVDPPWWILYLAGGLSLLFIIRAFFRMNRELREAENSPDPM